MNPSPKASPLSMHGAAGRFVLWFLLLAGSALCLVPLGWTISTAFKPESEISRDPMRLIPTHPTFENFAGAWRALPFTVFVENTVFVTLTASIGGLLSAALVAYGFARFRFRGRNFLFYTMLSTMMLPAQVTMIPIYLLWRRLGAMDSFFPLIVPAFFGGGAFNIFLLRQFFLTIPSELDEAMRIDGAGFLRIWWRLILPLSKPALATVAVFSFIGHWDDFMGPLIYLNSPENYTVSIGLRLFQDSFGTDVGQLMAASLIHIVPMVLVFLVCQRYFVRGIAVGGMGGR